MQDENEMTSSQLLKTDLSLITNVCSILVYVDQQTMEERKEDKRGERHLREEGEQGGWEERKSKSQQPRNH